MAVPDLKFSSFSALNTFLANSDLPKIDKVFPHKNCLRIFLESIKPFIERFYQNGELDRTSWPKFVNRVTALFAKTVRDAKDFAAFNQVQLEYYSASKSIPFEDLECMFKTIKELNAAIQKYSSEELKKIIKCTSSLAFIESFDNYFLRCKKFNIKDLLSFFLHVSAKFPDLLTQERKTFNLRKYYYVSNRFHVIPKEDSSLAVTKPEDRNNFIASIKKDLKTLFETLEAVTDEMCVLLILHDYLYKNQNIENYFIIYSYVIKKEFQEKVLKQVPFLRQLLPVMEEHYEKLNSSPASSACVKNMRIFKKVLSSYAKSTQGLFYREIYLESNKHKEGLITIPKTSPMRQEPNPPTLECLESMCPTLQKLNSIIQSYSIAELKTIFRFSSFGSFINILEPLIIKYDYNLEEIITFNTILLFRFVNLTKEEANILELKLNIYILFLPQTKEVSKLIANVQKDPTIRLPSHDARANFLARCKQDPELIRNVVKALSEEKYFIDNICNLDPRGSFTAAGLISPERLERAPFLRKVWGLEKRHLIDNMDLRSFVPTAGFIDNLSPEILEHAPFLRKVWGLQEMGKLPDKHIKQFKGILAAWFASENERKEFYLSLLANLAWPHMPTNGDGKNTLPPSKVKTDSKIFSTLNTAKEVNKVMKTLPSAAGRTATKVTQEIEVHKKTKKTSHPSKIRKATKAKATKVTKNVIKNPLKPVTEIPAPENSSPSGSEPATKVREQENKVFNSPSSSTLRRQEEKLPIKTPHHVDAKPTPSLSKPTGESAKKESQETKLLNKTLYKVAQEVKFLKETLNPSSKVPSYLEAVRQSFPLSQMSVPQPQEVKQLDILPVQRVFTSKHPRVIRWEQHPFGEALTEEKFAKYCHLSLEEQKREHIFHFPHPLVERFISFGKKESREDKTCYSILSEITIGEAVYSGAIELTVDEDKVLYHYYFTEKLSFELLKALVFPSMRPYNKDPLSFPELGLDYDHYGNAYIVDRKRDVKIKLFQL